MRSSDREAFANLFARSIILFLQLPPDSENGLDPQGVAGRVAGLHANVRQRFGTPGGIYHARLGAGGRKSRLLFTQQARVEEFAQAHASMVRGLCGLRFWASRGAQRFVGSTAQIAWYSMP